MGFFFLVLWLFDFSAIILLLAFASSSCLIYTFISMHMSNYARCYELMWTRATSASRSLSLICNGNLAFSHSVFTIDPVCLIAKQFALRHSLHLATHFLSKFDARFPKPFRQNRPTGHLDSNFAVSETLRLVQNCKGNNIIGWSLQPLPVC